MANLTEKNGKWGLTSNIVPASSSKTLIINTQNKYLDKDIQVNVDAISLDAARTVTGNTSRHPGEGYVSLTVDKSELNLITNTPVSGTYYTLTAIGSGEVSTDTGYIVEGTTTSREDSINRYIMKSVYGSAKTGTPPNTGVKVEIQPNGYLTIPAGYYPEDRHVYANKADTPYTSVEGAEVDVNTKVEIRTQTTGADIYYIVNPTEETLRDLSCWIKYVRPVVIESDTELYAFARKSNYADSDIMHVTYSIKNVDQEWGDISFADRAELLVSKGIISEADRRNADVVNSFDASAVDNVMWVAGLPESEIYNGKAYTYDDLHVYNYKKLLVPNVDYTVKYKNNINAGTATVTITGKGNYNDSVIKTFVIKPLVLTSGNVSAPDVSYLYNKRVQKGTTNVMAELDTDYHVVLKKGKDFDFVYDINDNYTEPGYYEICIVGKGNYITTSDEDYLPKFTEYIVDLDEDKKLISKMKFTKIANQYMTGVNEEVKPDNIEIFDKSTGEYLVEGVDFETDYKNNLGVGTATVIVSGKGDYTGYVVLTYKIVARPISKARIDDFEINLYDYTGTSVEQNGISLVYKENKNSDEETLTEGVDYNVTYQNNVNAGNKKAVMIITGIGAYTGTVKKNFSINPVSLSEIFTSNDPYTVTDTVAYTKGGAKLDLGDLYDDINDLPLVAGVDYTLSYKNNKNVYEGDDIRKIASVTVKGKGNYTGSFVRYYNICPSSIDEEGIYVEVADIVATGKSGTCKPKVTVYDSDGTKLAAGKDYEKNVVCRYVDDGEVTRIIDKKTKETAVFNVYAGDEVNVAEDIIPAGTAIEVFVTGKGDYVSDEADPAVTSGVFRYVERDIAKGTFKVADQYYINRYLKDDSVIPVEPDISDFDIASFKNGNITEELTADDFVIIGYSNNTKIGTGKVTIKGIGIYGGTKTITFKIKNKSIR